MLFEACWVKCQKFFVAWEWSRVWQMSLVHTRRSTCRPTSCISTLQWSHNERNGVSNHLRFDWLLNRLFSAKINENSKATRHWPLSGEFAGDRWIPRTKGHKGGKWQHLMTSSWSRHYAIQLNRIKHASWQCVSHQWLRCQGFIFTNADLW